MKKYLFVSFLAISACSGTGFLGGNAGIVEPTPPANLPAAGYDKVAFTDSRGCNYIRTEYEGNVTWVPRVTLSGSHICGGAEATQFAVASGIDDPHGTLVAAAKPAPAQTASVSSASSPDKEAIIASLPPVAPEDKDTPFNLVALLTGDSVDVIATPAIEKPKVHQPAEVVAIEPEPAQQPIEVVVVEPEPAQQPVEVVVVEPPKSETTSAPVTLQVAPGPSNGKVEFEVVTPSTPTTAAAAVTPVEITSVATSEPAPVVTAPAPVQSSTPMPRPGAGNMMVVFIGNPRSPASPAIISQLKSEGYRLVERNQGGRKSVFVIPKEGENPMALRQKVIAMGANYTLVGGVQF